MEESGQGTRKGYLIGADLRESMRPNPTQDTRKGYPIGINLREETKGESSLEMIQ
jgi:hypothetical protein